MGRKLFFDNMLCKKCGFMPWDATPDGCPHCGSLEFWLYERPVVKPDKPVFAETWIAPEEK